jgi:excisionase family DNA binding protein
VTHTREFNDHQQVGGLFSDQPQFLTVQQASKLLRVSTWALYQVIRAGELPVIRWGRRVVIQREDLASLVASRRDDGVSSSTRPRFGLPTRHTLHAAGSTTGKSRTVVTLGGAEPA